MVKVVQEGPTLAALQGQIDAIRARMREGYTKCAEGGHHEWQYRRPNYHCAKCSVVVSKSDLKAATD